MDFSVVNCTGLSFLFFVAILLGTKLRGGWGGGGFNVISFKIRSLFGYLGNPKYACKNGGDCVGKVTRQV